MKKKVYLDQNIYEDIRKLRDMEIIRTIQENYYNFDFFYSPAHIEEIVASQRYQDDNKIADGMIKEKLNNLILVTQNNEFLPSSLGTIVIQEEPFICKRRVENNYKQTTLEAEEIDKGFLSRQTNRFICEICNQEIESYEDFRIKKGIDEQYIKHINDINPEKLFEQEKIKESLNEASQICHFNISNHKKWNNLKYSHKDIEYTIQKLYEVLEVLGYKIERLEKYRNRMHDISHGIYATASDIFVVGDKKLYSKIKAIYKFLEIPTKVFEKHEFIDYLKNI